MKRKISWFLICFPGTAFCTPMGSFNAASGLTNFSLGNFFSTLVIAIVAVFASWLILAGVFNWVKGQKTPIELFFIFARASILLVLTSVMVGVVKGL